MLHSCKMHLYSHPVKRQIIIAPSFGHSAALSGDCNKMQAAYILSQLNLNVPRESELTFWFIAYCVTSLSHSSAQQSSLLHRVIAKSPDDKTVAIPSIPSSSKKEISLIADEYLMLTMAIGGGITACLQHHSQDQDLTSGLLLRRIISGPLCTQHYCAFSDELMLHPPRNDVARAVDAPESSKLELIPIHNCSSTPCAYSCVQYEFSCKIQPRAGANMKDHVTLVIPADQQTLAVRPPGLIFQVPMPIVSSPNLQDQP